MSRRPTSTAVLFLSLLLPPAGAAFARDLSFEERINAQEAIERVYYSHQIGSTKPFEEAVPRGVLENKVHTYLKETVALETFWKTPVTSDMLHQELTRMAARTRLPERLRELYAALGDDPFLIQECLARPVLMARLSRNFFAYDATIHAAARRDSETLRADLAEARLDPWSEHRLRTVVEIVRKPSETLGGFPKPEEPLPSDPRDGPRLVLEPEEFDRRRVELPERVGEIGPVVEERDALAIHIVLEMNETRLRVARFVVDKLSWDDWWRSVERRLDEHPMSVGGQADSSFMMPEIARSEGSSASTCPSDDMWDNGSLDDLPDPRNLHTAIWTGSLMVIWGGEGASYLNTGGRYDPATDSWTPTSTTNAPSPRKYHTAVWTGNRMVVWGGQPLDFTNTGGRYDPTTDTWSPTSLINAPTPRSLHTAIWTGSRMVVWGGQGGFPLPLSTGAQYDPTMDAWTPTSMTNVPSGRYQHTAVWTGSAMVVWGGIGDARLNTGGRYEPTTDSWTPASTTDAPSARFAHTAVWTGSVMVVWGGFNGSSGLNTGGRYDPAADTWTPTVTTNAPSARYGHTAFSIGSVIVVWGGFGGFSNLNTGGRYDPAPDTWTPTSTSNAPDARRFHTAIWTGNLMVVWGGAGRSSLNTGGRYEPVSDTWTPTFTTNAPSTRRFHTAVWTGDLMIVWGGESDAPFDLFSLNTGGRYDPATDSWTPTAATNAPSARRLHSAVWTGSRMVVWGGFGVSSNLDTGGQYNPIDDTWTPTSVSDAPSPRNLHTAVWTGNAMIVWGGFGGSYFNSGGRYDPVTDTWVLTSTTNSPSPRANHSAVWTGSLMVIWGGRDGSSFTLDTGGRYDPASDSWTSTSRADAPSARRLHSAIWTGSVVIVWGGQPLDVTNTGGRYDPAADTWTATSMTDAPSPRSSHAAVWTGSRMIIWGGASFANSYLNTGGRYDPATDTWTATSITDAPSHRSSPTAVWTGSLMVIWGGYDGSFSLGTGGRYAFVRSVDADGDGFNECQGDCDDSNPAIHPGATEICDGIDDNCDGQIDEGFEVGSFCSADLDECHEVIGTRQCRADGTGTQCSGDTVFHDTTPPVIACPANVTLECPATSGSIGFPVVTDTCDPKPRVVNDAPSTLLLGPRVVNWIATDSSGNHSSCQETITVVDTTPPQVTLVLHPITLWPPNHRMVPVNSAWVVSDGCDPAVQAVLVSVTSSEADDAPGRGDGNTTGDIQDASIGTPDPSVLLRAERSGEGPGRSYTLTYTAQDASGNAASALVLVMVPHDLGTGPEPVMMNVEGNGTPGMAHVYWNGVAGAEMYDLIQGDLDQITTLSRRLWLGSVRVLVSGITGTSYTEGATGQVPAVGKAFFYLVQYRDGLNASGWGTESSPWPAEPTSCDVGCPGETIGTSNALGDPFRK